MTPERRKVMNELEAELAASKQALLDGEITFEQYVEVLRVYYAKVHASRPRTKR